MRKAINLLRSIIFYKTFFLCTFFLALIAPAITFFFKKNREKIFNILLKASCRLIAKSTFAKIKIEGLQNLPDKNGFIIAANHKSFLDNFLLLGFIPGFKIPMIRRIYSSANFIETGVKMPPKNAMAAYVALKNKSNIATYSLPAKHAEVGDFTDALINLARSASVPIIPVAIKGASKALPMAEYLLKDGDISVIIGEPFNPENPQSLKSKLVELYNS